MDIKTRATNYNWVEMSADNGSVVVKSDICLPDAPLVIEQLKAALHDIYSLLEVDKSEIKKDLVEFGLIE